MENFLIFMVADALLLQEIAAETQACTKTNEIYNKCGSACPITCANYDSPPMCTMQCVPGCYCGEGYYKNNEGICVTLSQCKAEIAAETQACTQANEIYNERGSACPITCANYDSPPMMCTMQCVPGCYCGEGYYKNSEGTCVTLSQCKAEFNETYDECGSACPLTCANYKNPTSCTDQCVPGYYCKQGYYKNSKGVCVEPSQCEPASPTCPLNAEYKTCGTPCPLTCDNYKNPPRFCVRSCKIGCSCKTGYVLTKAGNCVLPSECNNS